MFTAKTSYSGKLKALFEVLFSNATTVCLTISEVGIKSESLTTNNALICVDLPASCFDQYAFTFPEPLYVGMDSHINQFFKCLKNKTIVTFSILHPFTLDIEIESTVDDSSMKYSAAVISAQNVAQIPATIYECEGVEISSSNFNQMCKSFSKSPLIDVTKRDGQFLFSFELAGISTKTLSYGKKTSDPFLYFQTFKSDSFARIGKLSSFVSTPLKLYAQKDKPLFVEAKSPLGTVNVYLTGLSADENL
jgi:Proliferating cell nuclear antigen, N-terminal domain